MKRSIQVRVSISLFLLLSMLSPVATLAMVDAKKNFKEGMKHEVAEEWDKAVESFALAVSESPKNPEYRLHLTRSLFNASQMFMKRGNTAAKEKDYEAAYLAFRRAYAFDPTNELAKSEMDRVVRLQQEVIDRTGGAQKADSNGVKMIPAGLTTSSPPVSPIPQKLEKLRDIPFPAGVDLQFIIKELAKDLELNVLFDAESFRTPGKKTFIELRNVTAAQALDYIFMQEGLFFQKVGPRTVIVANQAQRPKFQQLVLRTFYLSNAAPKDIAKVVQTAIPAQPGRSQTIVLTDDATNSITIRDTEENIRLIARLIGSLDKDRAEVVMDVAIYEVNKNDLLQLGNQVGSAAQLTNLGGTGPGIIQIGPSPLANIAAAASRIAPFPTSIATGILLPGSGLAAFQSKNNTKLIASTQIHAFNNEQSEARIGQRVPVKSATFQTGSINNNVGGNGVVSDVINYEQVGLTLNFKPLVFPNHDVQVEMLIESKDVAGAATLTPTFTERKIKGTARIQNNKTLLLASVAQDAETNGRQGLPFLGLIPILGRLFTAPTKDNRQVDIVIAVTPRVIRAPAILPDDEVERPTGSLAVPTNSSLEAMLVEEDSQERLALARRIGNNSSIMLPDRAAADDNTSPQYVQTSASTTDAKATPATAADSSKVVQTAVALVPVISSAPQSANSSTPNNGGVTDAVGNTDGLSPADPAARTMNLKFGSDLAEMKAGDKIKIPVVIDGSGAFTSAVIGLKFDPAKVAVRKVIYGDLFGAPSASLAATPFLNQGGKIYVSLTSKDGSELNAAGTLAFIEIEALTDGRPDITFDRDVLNFLTSDGRNFAVKLKE
jgi:general secretion pathway protein D